MATIGYGVEGDGPNAKSYWLIMSFWGEGWGVRGVGMVSRDHMLDGRYENFLSCGLVLRNPINLCSRILHPKLTQVHNATKNHLFL